MLGLQSHSTRPLDVRMSTKNGCIRTSEFTESKFESLPASVRVWIASELCGGPVAASNAFRREGVPSRGGCLWHSLANTAQESVRSTSERPPFGQAAKLPLQA